MERFAAFLRGMNLGGRRVKNDELRRLAAGLGFDEVATFRASGNLVRGGRELAAEQLGRTLEEGLAEGLGYEVPVFVRGAAELLAISSSRPFTPEQLGASKGKHQIILLRERPSPAARRRGLALGTEDDRLALQGRDLHWLPRGGISESALDLRLLEWELGATTIWTKGTFDEIVARHFRCGPAAAPPARSRS
jgi:uncharacterized protein (DUF1697 family)